MVREEKLWKVNVP